MSYLPNWQIKAVRYGVIGLGLFLFVNYGIFVGYRPGYEIVYEINEPQIHCENDRMTMVPRHLSNHLARVCSYTAMCSACWSHHAIQFANSGMNNQPVALHLNNIADDRLLTQPIVRSAHLADVPVQSVHLREYSLQEKNGHQRLLIHDVPPGDEILVQILLAEKKGPGNTEHIVARIDAPFGRVIEGDPNLTLIGRMLWSVFGIEPRPLRGARVITALSQQSSHWSREDFE